MCWQHEQRVGFHNIGAGKRGGLYVFYTSTSSSPPHLFSICLSYSLPSLSVRLLPDSKVCQELNLPPFLPSAAGMHVPPSQSHETDVSATNRTSFTLTSNSDI